MRGGPGLIQVEQLVCVVGLPSTQTFNSNPESLKPRRCKTVSLEVEFLHVS